MKFSVGTEYRFPTVVRHQGMVIVLALDEKRDIYYRVLAVDPAQPDDDKSWSDRKRLAFPNQIRPAGMSLVTVGLRTAERTASAPFQAVSDGKHVYLFRQSTDGTLYVDRFVFDPAPKTLNPAWEARFQRSRKRDLPASRKDTLGARDMESEPFFEPTTELTVVKGLQDGRFCVLLLPGRLPSQWRWQIFVTNSEGEVDSFSIRRGEDGLFDMADVQRTCLKWADVGRRFQTGPAALLYMQQEETRDEYGRPQRVKRGARVMLAAPVGSSRYALELDGADDCVSLGNPASLQLEGAITIEAWVKAQATDGRREIVAHGAGGVYLRIQDGAYQVGLGDQGASYDVPQEDVDDWIHLAGAYDGERGAWLLFRNGVQVAQAPVAGDADPADAVTVAEEWAIGRSFAGQINNVRLWSVARTVRETQQNMHRHLAGDERGLVGDWPLDEGSGDTVYDRAAENHGHLHVGYVLELDGMDDCVTIPNHDSINFGKDQDFTVAVWVKTAPEQKDTTVIDNMIVEKWSGEGGYPYVIRYFNRTYGENAGRIVVGRYDGSQNPYIVSNKVVNDGRFHHVAFVKDGSTLYLYLDGLLEGTTPDTTTGVTKNESPLYVGVRGGTHYPFSGQINKLRIWDRALVMEEIQEDMDKPTSEVEGAVGNWAFDEGAGDVIQDRAPGQHNGRLRVGHALELDGLDDYVELPPMDPDYANGFTVEAWVRYRSFQCWSRIIDFGNGAGVDNIFFANWGTTNKLVFQVHRDEGARDITAAGVLETGTWMHLAATVDRYGNAALYKNGQVLITGSIAVPRTVRRTRNYIGRSNWAQDGYFDGDMGEVRVWKVARTQEEIQQDMHAPPAGDAQGLVGYWLFDEGAGNAVRDRASGYHGRLCVGYAKDSHALVLDGVDDYVDLAGDAGSGIDDAITVEAWIKHLGGNGHVVNRGGSWDESGYSLLIWDGKIRVELQDTNRAKKTLVDNPLPGDGAWHHLAFTWDSASTTVRTYLDGKLQPNNGTFEGPIGVPTQTLNIGRNAERGVPFYGAIGDVRLWNVARSEADILADMRRLLEGDEAGLVGHWPLDEGAGETVHDQTAEAHDGQLHVGPGDIPERKWGKGPDNPNTKWGEGPDNPDDKWREGPEDPNDKWVVVPPIAILDFGVSRDGSLALIGELKDGSEVSLALSGAGGAATLPIPVLEKDVREVARQKVRETPVPMPTIAVDKQGLTVSAGLLNFAHSGDTPFLIDGADGLIHLYFRGDYGKFLVAQHDTLTARAEYTLPLDGTDTGPQLYFTARRPGTQMEGYEIAIAEGSSGDTCQVTIDNQNGSREAWQDIPRDLDSFLAVLNGAATSDAKDPLVREGDLVFYDYGSNVQREGVPDLTSADNPFFGSTLFAVGADNLPENGVPIAVGNVDAAEMAAPGLACAWIPEPQGKALRFGGADDYMALPHDKLAIAGDLTVEAWVKVADGDGSSDTLRLINFGSEGARFALGLLKEGEGYKVFAASEDKAVQTADAHVSPEAWTHLAAVYNATNALNLDGQGYVDCGNDVTLDMTEAMTVEAWVTPERSERLQPEVILSKWGSTEEEQSWRLYIDTDGKPCFETRDHRRNVIGVKANLPLTKSRSFHLAGAFDASPKKETVLAFDGAKDHVSLGNPDALNFNGEITIAAWIKLQAADGLRNIVAHGYSTSQEVFMRICNGTYEIGSWNGLDHKTSYPIPPEDMNTWIHLAGVYDGAYWILYRNGIEVSRTPETIGAIQVNERWAIGARGTGTERFFKGEINNVRIWKRALSIKEIGEDMDKPAMDVEGAVGNWAFDDSDKTYVGEQHGQVQDLSGNGHHGTPGGDITDTSFKKVDKCRYEQKIWVNGDLRGWRWVTVDDDRVHGHVAVGKLTASSAARILELDCPANVGDHLLLQDEQVVVKRADEWTDYSNGLHYWRLDVDRAVNGITREHRIGTEVSFLKRGANEIALTTTRVNIGRSASDTLYFQGIVDDVRLWKSSRRDWQVAYYQDQPLPGDAEGLVGDWRFEEGRGKAAIDSKGSNHGRLVHPESDEIAQMWTPAARNARLILYVNGRPAQTSDEDPGPAEYGGYGRGDQFTIGAMIAMDETYQQHMAGSIDEVRVWNKVRSPEQIRDNMYRALAGAEEALAGYWPLDEGTGTTIYDQTGNAQDGTLAGPQWIDSTAPIGNEGPEVRNVYGGLEKPEFSRQIAGSPAAVEYGDMQWDDEGNLFGVMKRCYIFRDGALQLVTGFKVGDLELNFVGQVQTAPTLIGYIEGAPPVPSENLTVKDPATEDYVGTSAIQLTEAKETTQVYSASRDTGFDMSVDLKAGIHWDTEISVGLGVQKKALKTEGKAGVHAYFEHSLGWLSEASKTAGTSKTVTKSLTLGGGWEEGCLNTQVGQRYLPNNMGYALVKSGTADLFALRLKRTGSLVALQILPNPDIPEDWNIIMFPLNPKYVKNGTLDGMVGLVADPDYPGAIMGERGSYFKPLEAYALKEQIEREAKQIEGYYGTFEVAAKAGTGADGLLSELSGRELGYDWETGQDRRNMVNTYVWTADGGFYSEEEQFSSIRQESLGGSYHFLGQAGLFAEAQFAADVGFYVEADALFGGHINVEVKKSKEEKAAFGVHVDVQGEGFLNKWEGDADRHQGTHKPCPGKVDGYRFMTFYLAPKPLSFDRFFEEIVDPEWLNGQGKYANEYGPNARALRAARSKPNEVWRVLHRVTYVSRIPPRFEPTPVEAVPQDVRRPANIEANMGLIQEIERIKRLLPPNPEESHLVILGRAVDRLLFGDASGKAQVESELEQIVSWWHDRDEGVKREIRQDLMTYLKAFYGSDLVAPEMEGEEQRVTEGLQALYTFEEGEGKTVHDVSGVGQRLNLSIEGKEGDVGWLAAGLALTGKGLVATPVPATKLIQAAQASNELTIEAWVKPGEAQQRAARIVTLSAKPRFRNFALEQDGDRYQVYLRTDQTDHYGTGTALEAGKVATDAVSHLVYTRDASGQARFYLNGVAVGQREVAGSFSPWDNDYHFGLGNEISGEQPWEGEVHLVAIYNRALGATEVARNYGAGTGSPR